MSGNRGSVLNKLVLHCAIFQLALIFSIVNQSCWSLSVRDIIVLTSEDAFCV